MQVVYYTIDIKFMIKELKLLATFLNAKQVLLYLIGFALFHTNGIFYFHKL